MAAKNILLKLLNVAGVTINPRKEDGHGSAATAPTFAAPVNEAGARVSPATQVTLAGVLGQLDITLGTLRDALRGTSSKTLTDIWTLLNQQREASESLWTDDAGAYFVRRLTIDEATGAVTITWTDANGNASAGPGTGARPVSALDREQIEKKFIAVANGTGYSIGDYLARVVIIDTSETPPSVEASLWINISTGQSIAAPGSADIEDASELVGVKGADGASIASTGNRLPVQDQHAQPLTQAQLQGEALAKDATVLPLTRHQSIAGLSFRETVAASATHTTGWVALDQAGWLRIQAELPAAAAFRGTLETSTAADPNAPTADDIQDSVETDIAGSALGGFDKTSFQLGAGHKWARLKALNLTGSPHEIKVKVDFTALPLVGAHLPLSAPLKKKYLAPIGRIVISAFERGNGATHNAEADADGNIFVRAVPNRASQAPGRVSMFGALVHATANAIIAAAPGAGKRHVITGYKVVAVNTSTTSMGQLHIRENDAAGAVKIPNTMPTAIVGVTAPQLGYGRSLIEPILLGENAAIFTHFAGGSVTASVEIEGYTEDL